MTFNDSDASGASKGSGVGSRRRQFASSEGRAVSVRAAFARVATGIRTRSNLPRDGGVVDMPPEWRAIGAGPRGLVFRCGFDFFRALAISVRF